MKVFTLVSGSVALLIAATLSACAPGSNASGDPTPQPTDAKTGVPSGTIELSLTSTPESGASMKAIIPAFEAKYPNVKVKYSESNFDDYNKSLNLSLASDQAPDIALLNFVGTTVKDKLVIPLDTYSKAYGWDKVFPSSQIDQWRVGSNGTTLGEGSQYASPAGFDFVGLYYNKAKAEKLGIQMPLKSVEEFEAALAKAKAAGELPLQLGNKEGHASFVVQLIGQSVDGPANYAKWTFGQPNSKFETPGNTEGATKLLEWTKQGYAPANANAVDLQGAVGKFAKGEGVFLVDGSWDSKPIGDALGANAGFLPFPGAKSTAIGTSIAYAVSSRSKNQQAAAAFLDFLRTEPAVKESFAVGQMPADASSVKPEPNTIRAELVSAWNEVNGDNGLVGYNNNATATMNDTLTADSQKLIGGKESVPGFLSAVQADWAKTHG